MKLPGGILPANPNQKTLQLRCCSQFFQCIVTAVELLVVEHDMDLAMTRLAQKYCFATPSRPGTKMVLGQMLADGRALAQHASRQIDF